MKVDFKYNDVLSFSFDLSGYKEEVKEIAKKYLSGELSSATDETGTNGFWDLAEKIIDENCPFFWKFSWSFCLQDFLYDKLKEYSKIIYSKII